MKRLLFLMFTVLATVFAKADEAVWHMLTDEGYYIAMSKVSMLVTIDDENAFSVLDNEGQVLAKGVRSVTFKQIDEAAAIKTPQANGNDLGLVGNELCLFGIQAPVAIFNTKGIRMMEVPTNGNETRINVANLARGVYIAKCGKQTFKFSKK